MRPRASMLPVLARVLGIVGVAGIALFVVSSFFGAAGGVRGVFNEIGGPLSASDRLGIRFADRLVSGWGAAVFYVSTACGAGALLAATISVRRRRVVDKSLLMALVLGSITLVSAAGIGILVSRLWLWVSP